MKIKIVGGPRDGEWVALNNNERYVDLIDPLPPQEVTSYDSDFQVFGPSLTHTQYTIRFLRNREGWELKFLAPADWSDAKAIEHQFQK